MDTTPRRDPFSTPVFGTPETPSDTQGSGGIKTPSSIIRTPSSAIVKTPSTPSRKQLTKIQCFEALLINDSVEMQKHVCSAILSIMESSGINSFQPAAMRNKFIESISMDIVTPGHSKLGPHIRQMYTMDFRRCLGALYRLACHLKIDLRKGTVKAPDPRTFIMAGLFNNAQPPYLFNQGKRTLLINATIRVFRATPNPPGPFMSHPLGKFLLDFQRNMIPDHQGPWVRREDAYFAPFWATTRMHFPADKDGVDEFVSTYADPTKFNEWQDFWMTPGEEIVEPIKWVLIIEKLLSQQYGYVPQPPSVPDPMPVINFILRPKLRMKETLAPGKILVEQVKKKPINEVASKGISPYRPIAPKKETEPIQDVEHLKKESET